MDMPMFPGLVDNPHWKARWHKSGAAALSPVCSRDSPWVEDTIGLMLKLKPLLRDLLPGDFPLCHYDGAFLPTMLATGMKLHSAQQWMQTHAPATFGLVDLANWTILAYEEAPRCPVSVACHGEVAHHTGPTPFVKQVRIMEQVRDKTQQGKRKTSSPALRPANDPVAGLAELQRALDEAFPQGIPTKFTDATAFVAANEALINISARVFGIAQSHIAPRSWPGK